jgi:hypothetical protein
LLIGAGRKGGNKFKRSKSQIDSYKDSIPTESLTIGDRKSMLTESPNRLQPKIKEFNMK